MNPEANISQRRIKPWHFIIVFIIILVTFLLYYVSNRSYIEITVKQSSGDIAYNLSSDSNQSDSFTSSETTVRRLVKKGTYQVSAQQDYSSALTSTHTKGFLQTTQVELSLTKESARSFVGDNPKQCIYYSDVLLSWKCRGRLNTAVTFTPATSDIPGYVSPITSSSEPMIIEGFVSWKGTKWTLSKVASVEGVSHILYPLDSNNNFRFIGNIVLGDLSDEKDYALTKYREGWLVYSVDGSDLFYYQDFNVSPERISSSNTNVKGLRLYDVDVTGSSIALTFNENSTPESFGSSLITNSSVDTPETIEEYDEGSKIDAIYKINKTEFILINGDNTRRYVLDFTAKQVKLCGGEFVCALDFENLYIFEISGNELVKKQTYYNVKQFDTAGDNLYIINDFGVLDTNIQKNTGYYLYHFGDYQFCGITTENILGVCIEGANKKSLLVINNEELTYPIDQVVYELGSKNEVESVSVYNNLIHISPNFGELSRNQQTFRLEYDPEIKSSVNQSIKTYLEELGLNNSGYQIKQTIN